MTETSRRDRNTVAPAGHRVAGEPRAVGMERREVGVVEQTETPQRDVERARRVSLRQNEVIPWTHHLMMQTEQGIER